MTAKIGETMNTLMAVVYGSRAAPRSMLSYIWSLISKPNDFICLTC